MDTQKTRPMRTIQMSMLHQLLGRKIAWSESSSLAHNLLVCIQTDEDYVLAIETAERVGRLPLYVITLAYGDRADFSNTQILLPVEIYLTLPIDEREVYE